MMQIRITTQSGVTTDVTELVPSVSWSGDYQQAARSLNFTLLSSPTDQNVPVVECPIGSGVQLYKDGSLLFDGFVVTRTAGSGTGVIDLSCYDRGFYLKRNKAFYKFENTTAEAVTAQIASEFGLETGSLAGTNITLSRTFISGRDTLYDIISTVYTLASQKTGKQYHIGFQGAKLCVTEKQQNSGTLVIRGGSNLISSETTESIEDTVNTVQIYDGTDKIVDEISDASSQRLYGRLQEILRQTGNDDRYDEARRLLEDNDVSQKITVECLGDVSNMTGGTVIVEEPYTGLSGLFFIDSDTHTWQRGQYYNRLVLNFKSIMNERNAGNSG